MLSWLDYGSLACRVVANRVMMFGTSIFSCDYRHGLLKPPRSAYYYCNDILCQCQQGPPTSPVMLCHVMFVVRHTDVITFALQLQMH